MNRRSVFQGVLCVLVVCVLFQTACASSERRAEAAQREETMREITYGRLLATKILERYSIREDQETTRYVNQVGCAVALFAGRSDITYHFAVLDSAAVNAFATPGGYVFITSGALLAMQDEAELAGVLAHEIAHINLRHIMKEFPPPREMPSITSVLASIILSRTTTATTAFSEVLNKAGNLLFARGYKIEDEFQSDATALAYVAATGYATEGLPDFLGRLITPQTAAAGYGTHPSHATRVARLKDEIVAGRYAVGQPRLADRFAVARKRIEADVTRAELGKLAAVRFGRMITEALLERETVLADTAATRYLSLVGKAVALFSGKNDFEYNFILTDNRGTGCFSAPGGYIIVSRGALLAMESEAELAAALAIQIAHINLGHHLASFPLPDDKALRAVWKDRAAGAARALAKNGYTMKETYAADRAALLYLAETGYDGEALARWIGREPDRNRAVRDDRIALIRDMLQREFGGKAGRDARERFRDERERGLPARQDNKQ